MTISVLTIEPGLFKSFLSSRVIRRAEDLQVLRVNLIDIRDYAGGSFRHIDDSPYGGGNGMMLRVAPVVAALEDAEKRVDAKAVRIALTPRGEKYTQEMARLLPGVLKEGSARKCTNRTTHAEREG